MKASTEERLRHLAERKHEAIVRRDHLRVELDKAQLAAELLTEAHSVASAIAGVESGEAESDDHA